MAKSKFGFFDFKVDGLLFVDQMISFLKVKEKEALRVLKGVNTTNLNRKIKRVVIAAAAPQDLDMTPFVKDKLLGGFKVRLTSKSADHQFYNLSHPYITGRGATRLITKSTVSAEMALTLGVSPPFKMATSTIRATPSTPTSTRRSTFTTHGWGRRVKSSQLPQTITHLSGTRFVTISGALVGTQVGLCWRQLMQGGQ